MSELIRILPAIALRGTTILPDMIVHFDISRSRSIKAVEEAMLHDQKVFLVTQKDPDTEVPGLLDVYKIGTVATVKQVVKLPKGVLRILLGFEPNDEWLEAEIEGFDHLEEKPLTENEQEAMSRNLKELFTIYCRSGQKISQELAVQIMENESLERLVDQIAINLPIDYEQRQKLLEAVALTERYELLCTILANEVEIMEIRLELQSRIKERIDKNQKEYILREQLRLIREELGEDNVQSEIEGYRKADHYGLTKVKERILEYLAVRTLTKKGDSPILCLVGPPGTGKTSIARSVAKALNKKYVRISLGGVRDEAEIRGHRRTYVGAMPGRIVQSLHQAGVKNPLMLLDEIDKVSSDYKGDTASALLEVLDSEQNNKFTDHYVEIPVDLSEVLFIATANDVQTIPRPLLDRMELIEITSYTENEKQHIGREHLIPKQMKNNGIKESQLTITDEALEEIISGYTKEAGVRSLERQIGRICRRTARKLLEEKQDHVEVTKDNLEEFLDRRRFDYVKKNDKPEVGIVRGLAWTSVGGDTLQIEVNVMPGTGDFMLTGQLGDVMKESAQAGISYIRSIAGEYQIEENFFEKHDIHIHIPEGAVPKDGPSAGITMATAMISAILNVPVRADLAMTGEITLRGRVLPIGGLKEKLLAAKKAGITTVLVPEKNRLDVDEMDHEITDGLTICFVNNMKEVLDRALLKEEK